MSGRKVLRSQEGQSTVEYILLLSMVLMIFTIAMNGLNKAKISKKLLKPLNEDFARTYQYGHPKAKGYDDGGPVNHPRAERAGGGDNGDNNFRIFINKVGS